MEKEWYLLTTRSRFEKKSNQLLNKNKIETFFPTIRELVQWSDRKKWIEKPLFPGYLFVKFNQKEKYEVLNTDGIARIIKFENTDYIIQEDLINGIREYLKDTPNPILINTLGITIGDTVSITKGPFAGLDGVINRINGKSRILITIDVIGKAFVIELKGNDVEKKMVSG